MIDQSKAEMIQSEFDDWMDRASKWVQRYPSSQPGRSSVQDVDYLRAAVVWAHAAMEQLMRRLLIELWPMQRDEKLKGLRLPEVDPKDRKEKFTFPDLSNYSGRSIDTLIRMAVESELEDSNYNHPGEIKRALERMGLTDGDAEATVAPYESQLGPMMRRRHLIVHRLDENYFGAGRSALCAKPG